MRVLVDQNLTIRLVDALVLAGHDALHISALGMHAAPDQEVFQICREQGRVLFTSDKRLTKYLAAERAADPSVVVVREVVRAVDVIGLVLARVDDISRTIGERGQGVFSLAPDKPTRVELLPLGSLKGPVA